MGNTDCLEALFKTKAYDAVDPNEPDVKYVEKRNKQGQTPLHVASFRSSKLTVQALLDNGADHASIERNPRRLSKDTAAEIADRMGRKDTAELLQSLQVTMNAVKFAAKMKRGAAAS